MRLITFVLVSIFISTVSANMYNFTRIDNRDGLSNNQIECIFKDSRGYVWVGTNFGLNRYDGYRFKIFKQDKNDDKSISFNAISSIQEDISGRLWIRSGDNYVVYDPLKEHFLRDIQAVIAPLGIEVPISIVHIDKQKNYYLYQANVGVHLYNVIEKKHITYRQGAHNNGLTKGSIVNIRDGENCFWVLHLSGLIERYNLVSNSVDFRCNILQQWQSGATIQKSLFIDKDGSPWIYPGIGDKGVLFYDLKKSKWRYAGNNQRDFLNADDLLISNDLVRDIEQEQGGNIWIATDHGGVNIWNKTTNKMQVLVNDPQNANSISQNSVISVYADNTGIMWVGTYKNGISYYHSKMFKFEKTPLYFYRNPQLENKDINSICLDTKNNLWLGTNGSGLIRYNDKNKEFTVFRADKNNANAISSDIIISSLEDKNGDMWFGSFMGGLNRLRNNTFTHYLPEVNNKNAINNKSVYDLTEDDDGNLWFATLGGGVNRLDASRQNFMAMNQSNCPGLSSNYVVSMFAKSAQYIYLSTSLGIDVLNTTTASISPVFKDKNLIDKLSDVIMIHALVDKRNQLWMATDNGINIYNPDLNTVTQITKSNGLTSEQVVSLVEDNAGRIWVGTRNGLACISVLYNKNDKTYDYQVITFDENDGLPSTIFNQNAVFKAPNGKLYFGSTMGYIEFDPSKIEFNTEIPKPLFTGIFIENIEISPDKGIKSRSILEQSITHTNNIELAYNHNNFSIHFSAMSYLHPEKNQYRYMLKGLDKNWIVSNQPFISYSNLAPGNYELIIFAGNNDNVWSNEALILKIRVAPPFWLSWWAMVFYILLLALGIWLIIKYNMRKQKREFEREQSMREAQQLHEMDEMKLRFFTNISHEFRTPLTLILNPVEKLLSENTNNEQRNLLTIIQRNANGLLELVNQLLDFRKLDVKKDKLNLSVGDAVAFVKDICYSFTDMANRKSINFHFSSSINELRIEFDPDKMKKIVYNLLSNAFKFTPESGKIDLSLHLTQELNSHQQYLKIIVADSGLGIPEADISRIFERFYRVENPENGHQTGTGVGLHIVSEYVQLHGGTINVESRLGKGSTFSVLLPVKNQLTAEAINAATTNTSAEDTVKPLLQTTIPDTDNSTKPLMLVVDDNEDFREFIASIFAKQYSIIKAEDGIKALELTLDKLPDIIVSDVMMPRMDGFEFCKAVKQDIRISHIPIILLTAKTGDENKYTGLEAGAEDYISKPFNMDMLQLKVNRIVERQKQQQGQIRNKIDVRPSEIEITSMDEKFVAKAAALIELNIENPDFLVEDLCREMGMSRVYFYKKTLALTDKTPSELIRYMRIRRAADLLERSQLFVNEIAYKVGFNDPKYFRKYFKEEYGINPNEYKKKFEKNSNADAETNAEL